MLRWQVFALTGTAVFLSISVIFQSLGKVAGALILSVSRQGFVYLPVLIITMRMLGFDGIIMSQAISDLISLALAIFLFGRIVYREIR